MNTGPTRAGCGSIGLESTLGPRWRLRKVHGTLKQLFLEDGLKAAGAWENKFLTQGMSENMVFNFCATLRLVFCRLWRVFIWTVG